MLQINAKLKKKFLNRTDSTQISLTPTNCFICSLKNILYSEKEDKTKQTMSSSMLIIE